MINMENKMLVIGIATIIVIAALLYFGLPFILPDNGGNETVNETRVIGMGDIVLVDYVLRSENGSVLDTSLQDMAEAHEIYQSGRTYEPLTVEMKGNNGYVEGFTYGLIGLENGSHTTFTVPPELGYGVADPDLILTESRFYNFSLYQELSKSYVESFNETYWVNKTILEHGWNVTVVEETNTSWVVYHQPQIGQEFINGGIKQLVYNVTNDTAFVQIMVEEGDIYLLNNPNLQQQGAARVSMVNETHVVFDWNSAMAGKTLEFEVWIRDIQ